MQVLCLCVRSRFCGYDYIKNVRFALLVIPIEPLPHIFVPPWVESNLLEDFFLPPPPNSGSILTYTPKIFGASSFATSFFSPAGLCSPSTSLFPPALSAEPLPSYSKAYRGERDLTGAWARKRVWRTPGFRLFVWPRREFLFRVCMTHQRRRSESDYGSYGVLVAQRDPRLDRGGILVRVVLRARLACACPVGVSQEFHGCVCWFPVFFPYNLSVDEGI